MDDPQGFMEWLRHERAQLAHLTTEIGELSRRGRAPERLSFLASQARSKERLIMMAMLGLRDALLVGIPVC